MLRYACHYIAKWEGICQGCFQHKKYNPKYDKLDNKPSKSAEQECMALAARNGLVLGYMNNLLIN